MIKLLGGICLVLSACLWLSLFIPQLNLNINLLSRGIFGYELKPASVAPRVGLMTSTSVWKDGVLIGHGLTDGTFMPKDALFQEFSNAEVIGKAAVPAVALVLGIVLISIRTKASIPHG